MADERLDEKGLRRVIGLTEAELADVVALVANTDVLELEVSYGSAEVLIRRERVTQPAAAVLDSEPVLDGAAELDPLLAITSPLVGTFHPTVQAGDTVTQGNPLGSITAMGMRTTVDAPQAGTVQEVLVADGGPVEYGQPLILLQRAGVEAR